VRAAAALRWVAALAAMLVLVVVFGVGGSPSLALALVTMPLAWAGGVLGATAAAPTGGDRLTLTLGIWLVTAFCAWPAVRVGSGTRERRRAGDGAGEAMSAAVAESARSLLDALLVTVAAAAATVAVGGAQGALAREVAGAVTGGLVAAVGGVLFVAPALCAGWNASASLRRRLSPAGPTEGA
jgi:hypothetical protein